MTVSSCDDGGKAATADTAVPASLSFDTLGEGVLHRAPVRSPVAVGRTGACRYR